jgi:uncharacterized protein YkwD
MKALAALVLLALLAPASARADAVIDAVNAERARHDLPGLTTSATLERSADSLARRLMRDQRFDHEPVSRPPFDRFGEALLLDFTRRARAAEAVGAWMDSAKHRHVVLDPGMTHIGAGVARGSFEGERATLRVLQVGRQKRDRPRLR